MDVLHFGSVLFQPDKNIGQLCEKLNNMVGSAIGYDTFAIRNIKWLWFVNNIIAAMNNDNILCGCFGLFPCYVAGILDSDVLCNKKLTYADYFEECISGRKCTISQAGKYVQLTSNREPIYVLFEAKTYMKSFHLN
jgi:hypothetical protein